MGMTISGSSLTRFRKKGLVVKSFSILGQLILTFFFFYSGWYLSNEIHGMQVERSYNLVSGGASPWSLTKNFIFSILKWALFLSGTSAAIYYQLYRRFNHRFTVSTLFPGLKFQKTFVSILIVLLVLLHIRTIFVTFLHVKGSSMMPSLREGEFILINRWQSSGHWPRLEFPSIIPDPYGLLRKWQRAYLPERGEIVAFGYPGLIRDGDGVFVKRVIGLPGDEYEFRNGNVIINGRLLDESYLAPETVTNRRPDRYMLPVVKLPEKILAMGSHTMFAAMNGCDEKGVVPPEVVLVLGDNRRFSRDSRSFGFVPTEYILGGMIR